MRFHRPRELSSRPSVSVVIPCYNYGRFLPEAVAGALDQDGIDVEVLIVDDASTDDSAEVAAGLAASDSGVRLLRHERNAGHIQTYNDGLAEATGSYVTLVSADDLLVPNALTRAAALMEAHPRVGLVYGHARSFTDQPPDQLPALRNWSVWTGLDWLSLAARRGRNFLSSPEAVMRREALLQAGGYDPRLPHSGDFDMWLRTAARWDVGRVNGSTQALYRVHDHNMHLTTYAGWLRDLEERRATFDILFTERAPDLPEVVRLRPVARRALAREAVRRGLTAYREDPSSAEASGLFGFAEDTDPEITRTPWWRLVELGPRRGTSFPAVQARRLLSRVRLHAEWRRNRRYGT